MLFLSIMAVLASSCSNDDYDSILGNIETTYADSKKTRAVEETKIYLEVRYDESVTKKSTFVSFSRITLTELGGGPESYSRPVLESQQDQLFGDSIPPFWRYVPFPQQCAGLIGGEMWEIDANVTVSPYVNFGDYKLTLYQEMMEETRQIGDSWICEDVQAGDTHVFSGELCIDYDLQDEFTLYLVVEKV